MILASDANFWGHVVHLRRAVVGEIARRAGGAAFATSEGDSAVEFSECDLTE